MPLPDEIVEAILLRLDEAADLARASAVCATFRRVAAAPRFLRCFRSLHPPPVLGLLSFHNDGVLKHRSAPAACALARAADFAFSFVPRDPRYSVWGCWGWCVWDALDGRVLLSMNHSSHTAFEDLVVCDPLHRRYVQIPPIPADLITLTNPNHFNSDFEHFLAPSSAEDQEQDELSFQVICNVRSWYEVVTLVFSSVSANWRRATSISLLPDRLIDNVKLSVRHYVRGCFYWARYKDNHMLVLDLREMKLTAVELPLPRRNILGLAIVDAGEDKLGVVYVSHERKSTLDLYCKTWWNNDGGGAEDWQHKIIPLPEPGNHCYYIKGAADGYLVLEFIRQGPQQPRKVYYILEVKTLLFERLCVSDMGDRHPSFFASFPPPLSLPTI